MKNYDKNKESSFLIYDDANKNYDEKDDTGYLFVVDVEYLKNVRKLHSDLPFLPERMKVGNCIKLVCNLQDKKTIQYMY